MKWCFLISNFQFLPEFLGKLSKQILENGDEILVVFGSKIAEYDKKKFFPEGVKFISMIDWQIDNYRQDKNNFYGLLWRDFFPVIDRSPFLKINSERAIDITSRIVRFFEFIFEKEKPDIVVSEPPSALFSLIAYNFCQSNGALYLGLEYSRASNKIDVYDNKFTCSKYEKIFNEISSQKITEEEKKSAREFIKKFISHEQLPSYMDFTKIHFSQTGLMKHFLQRIKKVYFSLSKYISSRSKYKSFDIESESIIWSFVRALITAEKRKIKTLLQKKFYTTFSIKEKYFFYPLHQQPESSTSVYATYYCNQLGTVKNISLSIPFPYKLYVKEHPVSLGTRSNEFYKELKKIPNVVLISPNENIENLVKHSLGVITLTSTVGMEAVLSGKPVYVFGDVFYSYHPLCRRIKNFEELEIKIKNDLVNMKIPNDIEDINIRFIISYFRNILPGGLVIAGEQNDTNDYRLIHKSLLKLLTEK